MNTNQYTQKTLEALQAAQQLAVEYQHNQLEPEHLLHALASQEQGLIPSSLPVEITATRTCERTGTESSPAAASAARWRGAGRRPEGSRGSPAARSEPASRTNSPASGFRVNVTVASWTVACSTGTTASASSGIGAPVMTRTAWPGSSGAGVPGAAGISPRSGRLRGVRARSVTRTAKPSICEFRNGGRAIGVRTGWASTRSSARVRATCSTVR